MIRGAIRVAAIVVAAGSGVFLVGYWLARVTVRPTPLLITSMKDVSYVTGATQQRQFLIDLPLADGKHFTEMTTSKVRAVIDIPGIKVESQPNKSTRITLPPARILPASWDGATIIRNAPESSIIKGYEEFAARWSTRSDEEGLMENAERAAAGDLELLYNRAGAKVDVEGIGKPLANRPAPVEERGNLGRFLLDADYAAEVTHCPDEYGDCFNIHDSSASIEVTVFDTEPLRQDDPKLSRLFDPSNPDDVISSAYLFVIAHPGSASGPADDWAARTKRSTSSTEARFAFAVLTTDRKAA